MSAEGISKVFDTASGERVQAIEEVSLKVERGEFVSVVGHSGCGKTTLLKIISGLVAPTTGTVSVLGGRVSAPLTSVGHVFQNPLLMEWRDSLRNILLPVELMGKGGQGFERRAAELMKSLKLEGFEKMYPRELSQGMQQRVSIARALIHDPSVVLMDEPFGALDELTREEMGVELLQSKEIAGKTTLFVTHSVPEAVLLGDRVVVLSPRPSRVVLDLRVDIPRPRTAAVRGDAKFTAYCEEVRSSLARARGPG